MKTSQQINLAVPENWNQLNKKQLRQLCRMIAHGISPSYRRQQLFMLWAGIQALPGKMVDHLGQTFYLFRKKRSLFYLSVEDYTYFLRRIDFASGRSELTRQLLPRLWAPFGWLHGPSNKLYNITYNEFIHAEAAFNRYMADGKNINHLNALCAVLYRQAVMSKKSKYYTGDVREGFNDFNYMQRARRFRFVPLWQRIAVFMFYSGSREALYQAHTYLRDEATIGEDHSSDLDKHRQLINTLNQGDLTRNKSIMQSPVWDVMGMLNSMVKQYKQITKK